MAPEPIDCERYRSLLMRDLAQSAVDTYLATKWHQFSGFAKVIGPLLLLLGALAGFREYKLQAHLDSTDKALTKALKEATEKLTAATILLGSVRTDATNANLTVVAARALVEQSSSAIAAGTSGLLLTSVALAKDAREATAARNQAQDDMKEVRGNADAIRGASNEVEKNATAVRTLHKTLIDDKGGLESLKNAQEALRAVGAELRRVKASETIVLEPDRSASILLPDPTPDEMALRYFEITITAHDAGTNMDLEYETKDDHGATVSKQTVRAYRSARQPGAGAQIIPLLGVPFEILVEYVASGIFINDFVILKIQPNAAQRSYRPNAEPHARSGNEPQQLQHGSSAAIDVAGGSRDEKATD